MDNSPYLYKFNEVTHHVAKCNEKSSEVKEKRSFLSATRGGIPYAWEPPAGGADGLADRPSTPDASDTMDK